MSALQSYLHVSFEGWLAIGAVVLLLLVLAAMRASRSRTTVVPSATADMMVYHLSRIADALDRGALDRVALRQPSRGAETPDEKAGAAAEEQAAAAEDRRQRVSLSMFGR